MESDFAMKPPVAILFANLKGNIGDFAILHAMLLDLKRTFPGQPLHVFSHGFYNIDESRLTAFRASSDVEFELIGTTYFHKGAPKLLARFVRLFGLWPVAQGYLVQSLTDRVTTHASQFREYDAIFLAGGGQMRHFYVRHIECDASPQQQNLHVSVFRQSRNRQVQFKASTPAEFSEAPGAVDCPGWDNERSHG